MASFQDNLARQLYTDDVGMAHVNRAGLRVIDGGRDYKSSAAGYRGDRYMQEVGQQSTSEAFNSDDYINPIGKIKEATGLLIGAAGLKLIKSIDLGKGTVGNAFKKTFENFGEQYVYTKAKKELPFLAQRYGFAKGFTKIDRYYTIIIEKDGKTYEKPFHALAEGEKEDINTLKVQAQRMMKEDSEVYSNYLNKHFMENFRKESALLGSANRYMNGDLEKREDLTNFFARLSKMDVETIHQFGKAVNIGEIAGLGKIRRYDKPGSFAMYGANEMGNILYDATDRLWYNLLDKLLGSAVAKQVGVEDELDAHLKLRRNIMTTLGRKAPLLLNGEYHYS